MQYGRPESPSHRFTKLVTPRSRVAQPEPLGQNGHLGVAGFDMLVICYGIPKSGSTLAFRMVLEVLRNAGYEQSHILNERPRVGGVAVAKGSLRSNFLKSTTKESIGELVEAIGPSRMIAMKSHARFTNDLFPWLEEMQQKRAVQVIASYRDPRDICLSAMDAGERSRAQSVVKKAFSSIDSVEAAARRVTRRIDDFRKWAALQGTLRLYYETVAFHPDEAISAIEIALGIKCDHERVKRSVFEDANLFENKAKSQRHREDMGDLRRKELTEIFRKFIRRACEEDDQKWYDKRRQRILKGIEA